MYTTINEPYFVTKYYVYNLIYYMPNICNVHMKHMNTLYTHYEYIVHMYDKILNNVFHMSYIYVCVCIHHVCVCIYVIYVSYSTITAP